MVNKRPIFTEYVDLTVFGEEPRPAYDRVHLSEFFDGKSADDLTLAPRSWYEENGIELRCGELITKVDRSKQEITSYKGETYPYDKLIIATGSAPFVPNIKGVDKKGVFVYRTIEDLEAIMAYGKKVAQNGNGKAAVLGGGLLGLEAAKAVKDLGLETHVVEFAPRLMPRQLDNEGGNLLKDVIEEIGIKIHLGKNTTSIGGNGKMTDMNFADGEKLDVQMLVISAGIRPRDEIAKGCDLGVGARGGIIVDEKMQTNDPNIFVIGEAALYKEMVYGLVAPGYEMAEVAVSQILGEDKVMSPEVDMSAKLKLIGVDVASFGEALLKQRLFVLAKTLLKELFVNLSLLVIAKILSRFVLSPKQPRVVVDVNRWSSI